MNEKETEAYDRAIKKMEDKGIDAYYQSLIIAMLQLEIEQLKREKGSDMQWTDSSQN